MNGVVQFVPRTGYSVVSESDPLRQNMRVLMPVPDSNWYPNFNMRRMESEADPSSSYQADFHGIDPRDAPVIDGLEAQYNIDLADNIDRDYRREAREAQTKQFETEAAHSARQRIDVYAKQVADAERARNRAEADRLEQIRQQERSLMVRLRAWDAGPRHRFADGAYAHKLISSWLHHV